MSGIIPVGLSLIDALTGGLIGPIVVRQRNIGGFVANVTIREDHEDELIATTIQLSKVPISLITRLRPRQG